MKKILIAEKSSKFVNLAEIDDYDLVIGIVNDKSSKFEGEIHIIAKISTSKYNLVSIQEYVPWSWWGTFETIQELIESYKNGFDFYLLDDWKEIKEFIK